MHGSVLARHTALADVEMKVHYATPRAHGGGSAVFYQLNGTIGPIVEN
jgi:hypothetical protein